MINREEIKTHIRAFLDIAKEPPIIGTLHVPATGAIIECMPQKSNGGYARTTSYIHQAEKDCGILIEVKLNHAQDYGLLILKWGDVSPGYDAFGIDPFGNKPQAKRFHPPLFLAGRLELEALLNNQER